jgi:iron complex outermembrane receptor protein
MFLMDGLNFNQGDGEATLEDLDVAALSYAEVFRGADAFKYGALTLGGAINLVPLTGYMRRHFKSGLKGGVMAFSVATRAAARSKGSSMNLVRLVSERARAFESIAARTQKSFLPISVTSLTTRWRIDFVLRWTGPIGICLAV